MGRGLFPVLLSNGAYKCPISVIAHALTEADGSATRKHGGDKRRGAAHMTIGVRDGCQKWR
jgi:hypothetical protein